MYGLCRKHSFHVKDCRGVVLDIRNTVNYDLCLGCYEIFFASQHNVECNLFTPEISRLDTQDDSIFEA